MPYTLPPLLIVTGIAAMLLAILIGPAFSPPEFSWVLHTTSEQAAQGSSGAWVMRAGFTIYGLAVCLAALLTRAVVPAMRFALAVFGAGLIGTAIWSNAPIVPGIPADMRADWLHSLASGVVGTAFAFACVVGLFAPGGRRFKALALVGLAASILIPLAMMQPIEFRGLLQRGMFLVSMVFMLALFGLPRSGKGIAE